MFSLTGLNDEAQTINLKCNPEYVIELIEKFNEDILSGYYMNKNIET